MKPALIAFTVAALTLGSQAETFTIDTGHQKLTVLGDHKCAVVTKRCSLDN